MRGCSGVSIFMPVGRTGTGLDVVWALSAMVDASNERSSSKVQLKGMRRGVVWLKGKVLSWLRAICVVIVLWCYGKGDGQMG